MGDLFGVACSPFELAEWQQATGIRPDMCMVFEAWCRQRTLAETFAKARSFGHDAIVVTWEPWEPTPEDGGRQLHWSHESILSGYHDDYIDTMARAMRDSGLSQIYLRYAHEMNGSWYPWRHDPELYVEAWRYLRYRMRSMRAAWNVKFVWSPNADLWRTVPASWLQRLLPYWPGGDQVDYVGFTMIEFGFDKHYPVQLFAERFALAREIFQERILAVEMNVARERATEWLEDLGDYIQRGDRPLPLTVLSQGESRAAASGGTGDLAWSADTDPEACLAVKRLVQAIRS